MSTFERYLTVWVALCIVVGIALGHFLPTVFQVIGSAEIAKVNLPVAALIWLMIVPMLIKIDFAALGQVKEHWRGIGVTLFINWAVKPFSMAALGWFFIGYLFRPYLPAGQIDSYIAGLIILAAAPCTAMVFVWSNLTKGEPHFTLEPGGVERHHHGFRLCADRRPIAGAFIDHSALGHACPVGRAVHCGARDPCPIVAPPAALDWWRGCSKSAPGPAAAAVARRACWPRLCCCLDSRASRFSTQPLIIGLLAVPILIQVYFNAGLAYLLELDLRRSSIASRVPLRSLVPPTSSSLQSRLPSACSASNLAQRSQQSSAC